MAGKNIVPSDRRKTASSSRMTGAALQGGASQQQNKAGHGRNKGGRPKGSRTKPKPIGTLAEMAIDHAQGYLPREQVIELRKEIRNTGNLDIDKYIELMIVLMMKGLIPRLLLEVIPSTDAAGKPVLNPVNEDVNERVKVIERLMALYSKRQEKAKGNDDENRSFFLDRFGDGSRLSLERVTERIEVSNSERPSSIPGISDGDRRAAYEARPVSEEGSVGPVENEDNQQGEADWD